MVWSYFNNLELRQTEVAHAIRERSKPPNRTQCFPQSLEHIINKTLEKGQGG